MTVTVTKQTINDGPRNVVVKCHLVSDSTDVTNQTLIDASDYSSTDLKIMGIKALLGGFRLDLHWNANANVDIVSVPGDTDVDQCYRRFGGLVNNASTGKNGDILYSTNGIANGEEGFIILEMEKRNED